MIEDPYAYLVALAVVKFCRTDRMAYKVVGLEPVGHDVGSRVRPSGKTLSITGDPGSDDWRMVRMIKIAQKLRVE